MAELTLDLLMRCEWLWQDDNAIADPSEHGQIECLEHLAGGPLVFQVEKRWRSIRSLAGGASETLDLQALALESGGLAGNISFSTVKLIVIRMLTRVAGLKLGGLAANEWFEPWQASGRGQEIGKGSPCLVADLAEGWAVTSGAKGLLITNLSGSETADFHIAIFGN